jgi:histidine triad (HIT) family protein
VKAALPRQRLGWGRTWRYSGRVSDCLICAKHADIDSVPGGEIAGDAHAVVSHLSLATPTASAEAVYLGYLFVESRRHVAELGDLTDQEAASIGRLVSAASRALQRSEGAEHVYAAVIGHGVDHLHVHVIARYPGPPREFWWNRVDEWPDAPRGDIAAVAALVRRLRQHFTIAL